MLKTLDPALAHEPKLKPFDWSDPFGLDEQLTEDERLVRDTAEGYAQERLQPRVTEAYLEDSFDREILREMGQLGLLGPEYVEGYWTHTVLAVGARRVVLTHWDDFFRPLDRPLRALPYAGDDLDVTMRELRYLAGRDGVSLHFPTLGRREVPLRVAAGETRSVRVRMTDPAP